MSKDEYQALYDLLLKHKAELEKDLRDNDYSAVESIAYSKHQQIDAIKALFEQLQYKVIT